MKILHILREEPNESVRRIIDLQSTDNEVKTVELYKGSMDYEELLELIFDYDKVISW